MLAIGQEEHLGSEAEEDHPKNKVSFVLSHTHVPGGINEEGDKSWLVRASWGIDYDYYFSHAWSLGLHSDMVLENFEIEEDNIIQERSSPIALILTGGRHWEHFTLVAGAGMEFAKEENFALARVGAEYGWELPAEWEIAISLVTDIKFGGYNSWVFGLGFAKLF